MLVVIASQVIIARLLKPLSEVSKSTKNVIGVVFEGKIRKIATLVQVGLINKVPARLEAVL